MGTFGSPGFGAGVVFGSVFIGIGSVIGFTGGRRFSPSRGPGAGPPGSGGGTGTFAGGWSLAPCPAYGIGHASHHGVHCVWKYPKQAFGQRNGWRTGFAL